MKTETKMPCGLCCQLPQLPQLPHCDLWPPCSKSVPSLPLSLAHASLASFLCSSGVSVPWHCYSQSFHLPQAPPLPSPCPFPSPIEGCVEPLRDRIKLTFVPHRGFHDEQGGVCHLVFVVVNMCNWELLREASFGQVICSFCSSAWRVHPLWCYVLFVWEILNNYVVGECTSWRGGVFGLVGLCYSLLSNIGQRF